MLSQKEFDVLVCLLENKVASQRDLSVATDISVGTINKILNDLQQQGLLDGFSVTARGKEALEPHKVRRAVFLAAGFGSRLVPITLNTPKPLVKVNGKRMIDTLLDAVVAAGIEEIVIVRGYLGEQFDQLLYKYPSIKFIDNPVYNESNNISTALCARSLLCNAYVMEADLVLYNPALIRRYEYTSNLLGFPVERTDDWCITADATGTIKDEKVGGTDCYQMIGISYWNEEHGKRLEKDILEVYNQPGGKERYWEQVAFVYKKNNYKVKIRPCKSTDVIEIDTFGELKKIDPLYRI